MQACSYTKEGDTVRYHYKLKDLRNFIKVGNEQGNVGAILVGRDGLLMKYVSYGTIEAPTKSRLKIAWFWHDMFDGPFPEDFDNDVVKPNSEIQVKEKRITESYTFIFFNN